MNLIERVIDGFGPEDHEQYAFVQYLEILRNDHPIKYTAIPNSTHTKSIMQRTRNMLLGLRPGMSDLIIVYPERWVLFLEMKRTKTKTARGTLSPEQREWLQVLSSVPNVEAVKADGCEEAMKIVAALLPPVASNNVVASLPF